MQSFFLLFPYRSLYSNSFLLTFLQIIIIEIYSKSFSLFLILNNWNFPQVWTNYYKIKVNRWYAHPCQRTRANSSRFSFSSRRNVKAVHAPRQQLNNCRQRPTSRTSKGILAPVEQRAPLFVTRNKRHHARSFRIEIRTSAYMARHFAAYKGCNDEFGRCLLIKILPVQRSTL